MGTKDILAEIDSAISRLEQARAILTGKSRHTVINPQVSTREKRRLSPEARARIAAAQKARWAKVKKTNR